jgi:serine/threonine-protein kinase
MKICPQCGKRFNDDAAACPHDGTPLQVERPRAEGAGQNVVPMPPNRNLVGRKFFGEYSVTKKLGEGGMGAVYLARQDVIDQTVALKVLHARAAESDEIVQRFYREAKVISMLSHPNIVRVFIFGRTEDDLLYLVMEFVKGRELRERLDKTGALDELLAIKIMKQACSALAEAHDLGIIHRDLKPDNILLTEFRGEQNFVKILDFGIAKLNEPDGAPQQQLTQAGIVYGTPEYVSPEQAQALPLDRRTDIYSMGCILYELICGRTPFVDKNPVSTLTKHVFEEPPRPGEVAPGPVAPSMEAIILKALAKKPEDRFEDAMAMFEALVGREREIMSERHLSTSDTYFPGSELTGMHQVGKLQEYLDAAASAGTLNDGGAPLAAGAAQVGGRQIAPAPSTTLAKGSKRHFYMLVAIGVLVPILLLLFGLIAYLMLGA